MGSCHESLNYNLFIEPQCVGWFMSGQSIAGTIGIVMLSMFMLVMSFLFSERGEGNVSLILLFVGIILAFIVVFDVLRSKRSS